MNCVITTITNFTHKKKKTMPQDFIRKQNMSKRGKEKQIRVYVWGRGCGGVGEIVKGS